MENDIFSGLNGLFSLNNREFGEYEYWSRIEGVVQNIPGIQRVRINSLGYFDTQQQDPTKLLDSEKKYINLNFLLG